MKKLLRKILRPILLTVIRLLGARRARLAAQHAREPVSIRPRILLVHPGPLGSLVMATPVLHALKEALPSAYVTMMVGPWSREVVERQPDIDQLLICPFPSYRSASAKGVRSYVLLAKVAKQLRQEHYDLAISLHRTSWWSATLFYLAAIPRRVGYTVQLGTSFLTHPVQFPADEHLTIARLRLISIGLQTLGGLPLEEPYTPQKYPLHFAPTTQEREWVSQRLLHDGIEENTPIVVIHPGTSVEVKQWRADAWAHCATVLSDASPGKPARRFVLTGSPGERTLLEEIAEATTVPTTIITDATVGQLAALLERAHLVLGVDSGPLHLAVAQRTPTVRLFGPTDPANYGPWGSQKQHRTVTSRHRCASCPVMPCRRLHFRPQELASHPCVRLISEQEVLASIAELFPDWSLTRKEPNEYLVAVPREESIL